MDPWAALTKSIWRQLWMKCDNCGKPGMFWLEYILKVNDTKVTLCDTCYDRLNENNEVIPMAIEPFLPKMFDKMSRFVGRAEDRDESERMTREEAEELADKMIKVLTPYVDFIEICGSYRRGREDPGDLDIVIIIKEGYTLPEIVSDLESSGLYTAVNWLGEKKTQIVVDGVKIDIKVSTTEGLGAALLYFTGPSGYNIGMRRAAKSRGMKLNEYGIWDRDTNTYLGGATEEEIYEIMDKTFKPAHKRAESEDYGVRPVWMAETFAAPSCPYCPSSVEIDDCECDFCFNCGEHDFYGHEYDSERDIVLCSSCRSIQLPTEGGFWAYENYRGAARENIYNFGLRQWARWQHDSWRRGAYSNRNQRISAYNNSFPHYFSEGFESEDSKEYLVEIRNTRGDVLWRSPCPDYDYLIKEINHMLKTHYYAIDVFTTEYGRKIHMATIKYGKAESGPLAAKLNESLIFRAESFEAELDGMELPVCCGMGWELFPYNGDIIITCQGYTQYFGRWSEKHYCGQSKTLKALQDGILWEDCGYCGSELWDNEVMGEIHTFKTNDGLVCKRCYEEHYKEDEDEDFESETIDWTDADLFVDWLKDENIIFHDLTNRTHKGLNYGAFRRWENQHGLIKPTRRLWEEANFHMFEQTSWELMNPQSPYPFALKAEEGLQVMAAELSGFLVSLTKRAGTELDMDDWDDVIVIVDLSAKVSEDELMMVFPDGSEIELALHNPKIAFVYDEQEDTAELDWVVNLKIVVVDDNYEF